VFISISYPVVRSSWLLEATLRAATHELVWIDSKRVITVVGVNPLTHWFLKTTLLAALD
jgi:hypothetical protein